MLNTEHPGAPLKLKIAAISSRKKKNKSHQNKSYDAASSRVSRISKDSSKVVDFGQLSRKPYK